MKRWLAISAGVAAWVTLGLVPAFGAIAGAPHDLSDNGYSKAEICIFCHTPHHSRIAELDIKLWSHKTTVGPYQLYGGGLTSASTPVGQPGKNSKICLSCHDGTVAVDAMGSTIGDPVGTERINEGQWAAKPGLYIGTDLRNDHPVGVPLTVAAGKFKIPTGGSSGGMKLYPNNVSGDTVECASCHGVHGQTAFGKYLKVTMAGSALCLNCHIK